jgi:TRAP-type C4-dicarboxylate transport system substrate-binding protein
MREKVKQVYLVPLVAVLLIAMVAIGCTPSEAPEEPIKLRYTTGMTPSHYFCSEVMPYFEKQVEERTNGRVEVELYPGGELYSYQDGMDACVAGTVEMGLASAGQWSGYNPVYSFSDYFLIMEDIDQFVRARDAIHPIMESLFEEHNIKLLCYSIYGSNSLGSKMPIESLDDLRGMKIRAPVPGMLDSLEAWGATPANVAAAEVYDALSKGAIDAAVTSWASFENRKFYEVVDYFTGPIGESVWVNYMNMDTWNSLPSDIQSTIMDVCLEMEEQSLDLMKSYDAGHIAALEEAGTVHIMTKEEVAEWREPLLPVYDAWIQQCADAGYGDQAEQIMEALKAA